MKKNKLLDFIKKNKFIISFLILFFLFLLSDILAKFERKVIEKNGIVINVRIMEYIPPGKGGYLAHYKCMFDFGGFKKILLSQSTIKSNSYFYIDKEFPALYSVKYDAVRLLMTPKDFEEFNRPFPDSLLKKIDINSY